MAGWVSAGCPGADSKRGVDIETAVCVSPTLWWLGRSGFALKFRDAIVYIDPDQPHPAAGLILCTNQQRIDGTAISAMLAASPRAKLVIPKSAADHAHSLGIPYSRMVTTDAGLRVEYLDDRIYAVPSARDQLDWTPLGGYPYLGYLVRFGAVTIYHSGDCVLYEGIVERLRPYNVTVALLPIGGPPHNFEIAEAAQLSEDIGARWLVPMNGDSNQVERFVGHLLGYRPAQAFKVLQPGKSWAVPA